MLFVKRDTDLDHGPSAWEADALPARSALAYLRLLLKEGISVPHGLVTLLCWPVSLSSVVLCCWPSTCQAASLTVSGLSNG
jgi:hypothetical protein